MNEELYKRNVVARASTEWYGEKAILSHLRADLFGFFEFSENLDKTKKAIFYGRGEREYADSASCKNLPDHINPVLFHALLGVLTEAGEIAMALLKALPKNYYIASGEPIDAVNIQEELGDTNWYRVLALHHLGQSDAENRAQNDAKLEKRFGPVTDENQYVFTEIAANNRDLETERATLEGIDGAHKRMTTILPGFDPKTDEQGFVIPHGRDGSDGA